jgi:hypothetical protein
VFLLLSAFTGLSGCVPQQPEQEMCCPKQVLSEEVVEFGKVELGESVEHTIYLSNVGELGLGVGSIEIGSGYTENFSVSWDPATIDCSEAAEAASKAIDSESGWDSRPLVYSDPANSADGKPALFILNPGCKIPIKTSFIPISTGKLYGSLIIESVQASDSKPLEHGRDPFHWKQLVYLNGETKAELPLPAPVGSMDASQRISRMPVAIGPIKPGQNACFPGEKIPLSLKIIDPDGRSLTYAWSDDSGSISSNFDNPAAQAPSWTCPELTDDSDSQTYKVYAVAYDTDNNQLWAFEEILVYRWKLPFLCALSERDAF